MNKRHSPTYLGQNVLVVVDSVNGFLEAFRALVESLTQIADKSFTLLSCCPTHYWEHSGINKLNVQQQTESMTSKQDDEFQHAEANLNQARAILQDAGAVDSRIRTKIATEDSFIDAVMTQLKQHPYTGVIVSKYHQDTIARLQRTGLTDLFRKIPDVEVCTLELKEESPT